MSSQRTKIELWLNDAESDPCWDWLHVWDQDYSIFHLGLQCVQFNYIATIISYQSQISFSTVCWEGLNSKDKYTLNLRHVYPGHVAK